MNSTNSKNIVLISSSIPTMLSFRRQLTELLLSHGHNVHIIWNANKVNHNNEFDNITTHPRTNLYPIGPRNFFSLENITYTAKLYGLMNKIKPDLAICFESPSILTGNMVFTLLNWSTKVINFFPWLWKYKELLERSYKWIGVLASKMVFWVHNPVVAMNTSDEVFLRRVIKQPDISVIPAEYMDTIFTPVSDNEIEVKFSNKYPTFAFIWRVNEEKWATRLLKALELLPAEVLDKINILIWWHICGNNVQAWIDILTKKYPNIYYLGVLNSQEVRTALSRKVHCTLLPSRCKEGVPTILRESSMSGVLSITTIVPGCNKFFFDNTYNKLAISCSTWEPEDIKKAILEFWDLYQNNKQLLIERVKKTRNHVQETMSNEHVTVFRIELLQKYGIELTPLPAPWADLWEPLHPQISVVQ